MTLVEFIAPLRQGTHKDRVLAVLYFSQRYETENALAVNQIRDQLKRARIPKWATINISDILSKSGHYVDTPSLENGKQLWNLTDSGTRHIEDLLGLPSAEPEIENDVSTLSVLVKKIRDPDVQDYIEESLKCLRIGAFRACTVFLWSGAIRTIQKTLLTYDNTALNTAVKKHDPKAREVKSIDHFAYIKDITTLLAALELEIFDKTQKDTLEEASKLRNRCGHPGKYIPGVKKTSSFIEDVLSIVFKEDTQQIPSPDRINGNK